MGTNHKLANEVIGTAKVQIRFCSHFLFSRSRGSSPLTAPRPPHPIPRFINTCYQG